MKKIFLIFSLQVIALGVLFAQKEELMLRTGDKGLYLEHKVTPKENFYSIGRLFNASAKDIASFNALDMAKGLNIGQVIRIPLSTENFSQNVNEGMPVYVLVTGQESLSHISSRNNKVSVDNLRLWNDLSEDNVKTGTKLIAGFLISGELAKANSVVIAPKEKPLVKSETNKAKEENKTTIPVTTVNPPIEEKKEIVKEAPKKEEVVTKASVTEAAPAAAPGYFKNNFEQQIQQHPLSKEVTVTSGIFKTTSGWQNGKYYALLDGVEPGTVIKVINPSNNAFVYAKVLGPMKGIRQNQGLDLRISDATLPVLGISDPGKFIVKVNY